MRFGPAQVRVFGTDRGSYSQVTPREVVDSQVTLTDFEAELAISHFGRQSIHEGKVGLNPTAAAKVFRQYRYGTPLDLNLIFPKPGNPELRLYLSASKGFKPAAGDVWFMYVVAGEIWIGALTESEWNSLISDMVLDEGDDAYVAIANEPEIRRSTLSSREVYGRDRNVAIDAFVAAGYRCEFDVTHSLFVSRATGRPYLEPHHLVPISLQANFARSLDVQLNVFALCPACHRAIHHAEGSVVIEMLRRLIPTRDVLGHYGIDEAALFSYYSL